MDPELYHAADKGIVMYLPEAAAGGGRGTGSRQEYIATTHQNNNILHVAARSGRAAFVEAALRQFSVLSHQPNSQGDTPLHVAARFGHLEVVKLLTSFNKSLFDRRKEKKEETEGAVGDGDAPPIWRKTNSEGNTALHEASRNGHEKVALHLLGLDTEAVGSVNGGGESVLYLAAESCCSQVISAILNSRSTYSAQGPRGQNALHVLKDCSRDTIDRLLTNRPELAKELDEAGKAAIHYAVEGDYRRWAICMLEFEPSIAYLPDAKGFTPLLRASSRGWWQICRKMLEICPESIESRNSNGQNVLHLLFVRNYSDGKKFLKIPNVKELINERDNDGNTALHLAIKNNDHEKARLLVSVDNVNLKAVNKEGRTALDMCEPDWKLSYKQRIMWLHLAKRRAPRGRHPNQYEVPVGGPQGVRIQPGEDMKQVVNTFSVVAALLVTVTFAAAFTMPGGINAGDDEYPGTAVLIKKASLKVFVLSDTVAMCCSITAVFFLIWAMFVEQELLVELIKISWNLLKYALSATVVAFVTGVYAVTASQALWVAILVCIVASVVPFVVHSNVAFSSATGIWFWPTLSPREIPQLLLRMILWLPMRALAWLIERRDRLAEQKEQQTNSLPL